MHPFFQRALAAARTGGTTPPTVIALLAVAVVPMVGAEPAAAQGRPLWYRLELVFNGSVRQEHDGLDPRAIDERSTNTTAMSWHLRSRGPVEVHRFGRGELRFRSEAAGRVSRFRLTSLTPRSTFPDGTVCDPSESVERLPDPAAIADAALRTDSLLREGLTFTVPRPLGNIVDYTPGPAVCRKDGQLVRNETFPTHRIGCCPGGIASAGDPLALMGTEQSVERRVPAGRLRRRVRARAFGRSFSIRARFSGSKADPTPFTGDSPDSEDRTTWRYTYTLRFAVCPRGGLSRRC